MYPVWLQDSQYYLYPKTCSKWWTISYCCNLFFALLFFLREINCFVYILQQCIQCPEKFSSYEEHCKHVENTHFGKWKYKCGLCELIFDQKDEIKSHRAKVHTVKREPNNAKKDGGTGNGSAGENQDGEKSPKKKIAPKICDICG